MKPMVGLYKKSTSRYIRDQVKDQVWNHVRDQVRNHVWDQAWDPVRNHVTEIKSGINK